MPLTAFLRPFNVLGWAALAIGDLQFVAPRDETVLAAGLAWERASSLGVTSLTSRAGGRETSIRAPNCGVRVAIATGVPFAVL